MTLYVSPKAQKCKYRRRGYNCCQHNDSEYVRWKKNVTRRKSLLYSCEAMHIQIFFLQRTRIPVMMIFLLYLFLLKKLDIAWKLVWFHCKPQELFFFWTGEVIFIFLHQRDYFKRPQNIIKHKINFLFYFWHFLSFYLHF